MMTPELHRSLAEVGRAEVDQIDIAEAALNLAAIDYPKAEIGRYRDHLDELTLTAAHWLGQAPDIVDSTRAVTALSGVISGQYGYRGDAEAYDDLQNANLIRVIDRRRGLPVALGIIYMHVARGLGWGMHGIAFPGHFLVRLEVAGERLILDPFDGGTVRDSAELRGLLKALMGAEAELHPRYHAPVDDRSVLLRLQDNLKIRQIRAGNLGQAAAILQAMVLIAPDTPRLRRELGLVHHRMGHRGAAIEHLEAYLMLDIADADRQEIAGLLRHLRQQAE